jgi:oxygen-independent coproporphyrinogen-3 oxidase
VRDGLLDRGCHDSGRAALTLRGRLLADAVVRDLAG